MASYKERLYPSISSPDMVPPVTVSSDEESDNKRSFLRPPEDRQSVQQVHKSRRNHHRSEFERTSRKGSSSKHNSVRQTLDVFTKKSIDFLYTWKVVFIGLAVALMVTLCLDEDSARDNYLMCSSSTTDVLQPCIADLDKEAAVTAAIKLRDFLHQRAGKVICGREDIRKGLSVNELQQVFVREWGIDLSDVDVKNVIHLFLFNAHWGIRIYGDDDELIKSDNYEDIDDNCSVESTKPLKALSCRIREWIGLCWDKIRTIFMFAISVLLVVVLVKYYLHLKRSEEAAVYMMVERIMKLLSDHYKKSQRDKDLLPYLAIIHVRDALILPSERHKNAVIWEKAVKWISSKESRVRVETRRIAGEDLPVWKWIYSDPIATEEPDSMWPGKALEDYPPGMESKMAPPVGTPSVCVRVKNMFESVKKMDSSLVKDIRNAVVRKCQTCGDVVHIYVDKRSAYGCVYFKMDCLKNAIQAYNTFHGCWFGSRLVTAKYIPEQKYYKWFPAATAAKTPLTVEV